MQLQVSESGLPVLKFLGTRAAALADVRDDSVFVAIAPMPNQINVHQLTRAGSSYTVRAPTQLVSF
jgi:hypothetical protein